MSYAELIEVSTLEATTTVVLRGRWCLAEIKGRIAELREALEPLGQRSDIRWQGESIEALDSAGAILLWQAWGRGLPQQLDLQERHRRLFERLDATDRAEVQEAAPRDWLRPVVRLGWNAIFVWHHVQRFVVVLGQLLLDAFYMLSHPARIPRREISANIYKSGVRAMPVTALVGFLIGVAISYLSALQLRQFGADIFIVNILGLGIIRELGPMLVAVLVAGRSGSAMTAQLGVMRVTEEIDALAVMGVSNSLRLVLPKVLALTLTMPMLVLWTSAIAIFGGMVAANLQLDLSYGLFLTTLAKAVPLPNLWIALAKGLCFGFAIALVACHFGLRVRPNTESLSTNTTAAVVSAITVVIVIDAIFAIATRGIGIPR